MKGYDIDGVITKGILPEIGSVVISGRTIDEYDDLVKKLAQEFPVYIRYNKSSSLGRYADRVDAGFFKSQLINLLKVTEFYEDDEIQIEIINKENPSVVIHKI